MAKTINDVYLDVRRTFIKNKIFSPDLEARELVSYVYKVSRNNFPSWAHVYSSDKTIEELNVLVERRLAGEPVAYIINEWDFYGLTFYINKDVLIPRSDTETLAGYVIDCTREFSAAKVLDLCCGSGCIGITIAKNCPKAKVVCGDISDKALIVARENARRNEVGDKCLMVKTDALKPLDTKLGKFNVLVSNPPYIKHSDIEDLDVDVKSYEPHLALDGGYDGYDFYRNIVENWKDILIDNGIMAFECGMGQCEDVAQLMQENGFYDIKIISDLSGVNRVVSGRIMK